MLVDILVNYFNTEISNKVEKKEDELIIEFATMEKARIKVVSL